MDSFVTHTGKATVLDWSDVNTDLIIPARYLKRIERTGYGPLLFADKRYVPGGAPDAEHPERHGDLVADFPLNTPQAQAATILLVGRNFGCGSSREHAVWAVHQAGFKAVIAPGVGEGFADIFEGNAFQNGLLPIEIPEARWQQLREAIYKYPQHHVTIDLHQQMITFPSGPIEISFEVPENHRRKLLSGIDAISETLELSSLEIEAYEDRMPDWMRIGSVSRL